MTTPVRIFIEPSGYRWLNLGDALMLETSLRRLRRAWPGATITVHSLDRQSLSRADAAAAALAPSGSRAWSADSILLGTSSLLDPLRRHVPRAMRLLARGTLRVRRENPQLVDHYLHAVRHSDLTLVSGSGSLSDAFQRAALTVLETLELAMDAGAATALVGQGIGPMTNRVLFRRAASVLPRVGFIALRESVSGLPLLDSLGVDRERVLVTGDDAIEPAWDARPATLGSAIGVNVRKADYAAIDANHVKAVGEVVTQAAHNHASSLVPVAVSRYPGQDDLVTVRQMLGKQGGGENITTTQDLLRVTGLCRVVVAGSYHAAVVALSMGIPVIGVAASTDYVDKFRGLVEQFGRDCRYELAGGPDFQSRLARAVNEAWRSAEEARPRLLAAAEGQIAAGRDAYRRVASLIAPEARPSHR